MAIKRNPKPLSRDILEATASIIGPTSAAAIALADANSHDGKTEFFIYDRMIIVKKIANHSN